MNKTTLLAPLLLAACSGEANHLGNPLLWPFQAAANGLQNAAYNETRGQVEIFVKQNHPALIADVQAGGGPVLTEAFDIAKVPQNIRAAHTLQMQSDLALYANNPGATVVAIMVVAG